MPHHTHTPAPYLRPREHGPHALARAASTDIDTDTDAETGMRFACRVITRAAAVVDEPTDEERAQADTILERLAPCPLGATPQARLDRIREAVTALALVGARSHSPLGHLAGDCATTLAP